MKDKKLKIYCDGGARGNPGPAASAFVAVMDGKIIHKESIFLGKATNNYAEYQALIIGLKWLGKTYNSSFVQATFILDSELVARQMIGRYKVKSKSIKALFIKAKALEEKVNNCVAYTSVARHKNRLPDLLVNQELDKH